jgi:hypothetical protein
VIRQSNASAARTSDRYSAPATARRRRLDKHCVGRHRNHPENRVGDEVFSASLLLCLTILSTLN